MADDDSLQRSRLVPQVAWWEIKPSALFHGEWLYRRVPGHGLWRFALHDRGRYQSRYEAR